MQLCEEVLAWVTLTRAPALAASRLTAALGCMRSARALVAGSDGELECAGIPEPARQYLRDPKSAASAAEIKWLEGERHHLLPFTDPGFPPLLRAATDHPIALYASGSLEALLDPQLAVVGSRNPSPQGLENAFEFALNLGERGLAITSGLAEGIDTCAHRGALAAQGVTLAVLGCGVDRIYPRSNRALGEAIEQQGALVSEFPLGTPPRRVNFPQRNRIIASMALGTLVVEAARSSGSLITARSAHELGRKIFAIPGSIHNPLSRGCHQLIKRGAQLTETADDILSKLDFSEYFSRARRTGEGSAPRQPGAAGMDKEHKILLDALGFDPADLDMLIVRTGFKPEAVSSMMLILELEGHVKAAPGGRYSRVANRRAGGER